VAKITRKPGGMPGVKRRLKTGREMMDEKNITLTTPAKKRTRALKETPEAINARAREVMRRATEKKAKRKIGKSPALAAPYGKALDESHTLKFPMGSQRDVRRAAKAHGQVDFATASDRPLGAGDVLLSAYLRKHGKVDPEKHTITVPMPGSAGQDPIAEAHLDLLRRVARSHPSHMIMRHMEAAISFFNEKVRVAMQTPKETSGEGYTRGGPWPKPTFSHTLAADQAQRLDAYRKAHPQIVATWELVSAQAEIARLNERVDELLRANEALINRERKAIRERDAALRTTAALLNIAETRWGPLNPEKVAKILAKGRLLHGEEG